MELLNLLSNILFGSATIVGIYAIGRLFYVAGTAPTNVQQRASRPAVTRDPVVYPTMALDTSGSQGVAVVVSEDGSRRITYFGGGYIVKKEVTE
jgi:hypothetical protein